jgi:hypothetical protein
MSVLAPVASSTQPPARSIAQRMAALHQANEKRSYRAQVKRDLKAQRLGIFDALDDPMCDTMRVYDVLEASPKLGRCKIDKAFRDAQISHSKTCAGITMHQRMRLATVLTNRHPDMVILFRAPEQDSVLADRTMDA